MAQMAQQNKSQDTNPASSQTGIDLARGKAQRLIDSVVPKKYRDAKLTDFDKKLCPAYNPIGYCLRGRTGIGKTYMATALAREYLNPERKVVQYGTGELTRDALCWVTSPMIQARLRSSFNKSAKETEYQIIEEFVRYRVLLLDDLGAEKQSEFSAASLYVIISERLNDCKPTVITSNMTMEQINQFEPRLASRFAELGKVKLPSIDRRMQKEN